MKKNKPRTMAIVGPASYLKGMNLGAEIDAHDFVVRINWGHLLCESLPQDFGRRTTHAYVNNGMFRDIKNHNVPEGVRVMRKRHVTGKTLGDGYEATTGIVCIVDMARQGNKITVYGFDFYAGGNDGIIPTEHSVKDSPEVRVVKRELVHATGYEKGSSDIDPAHFRYAHVGGLRDFALFLKYQKMYGIKTDSYMAAVIEKNRGRV